VRVVTAVFDGVNKLADDQQGGIAGVVMDVFQPLVNDGAAVVAELKRLTQLI